MSFVAKRAPYEHLSTYCYSKANIKQILMPRHNTIQYNTKSRMWANAKRDVRPAEYMWRPLFNPARFG